MSNSVSTTQFTAFDQVGRILQSQQIAAGGTGPKTFTYGYSLAGLLTSVQFPSGRQVTTTFDDADRITGVSNAATSRSYAGSISYAANNQVQQVTFGNSVSRTPDSTRACSQTASRPATRAAP